MISADKVLTECLEFAHKRLFKEKQTRNDVVLRKERNKDTACTIVKTTWKAFCRRPAHDLQLSTALLEVNKAITEAYILSNLHVTRLCEQQIKLPELSQTFFYQCLSAVSEGDRKRSEIKDMQFRQTVELYNSWKCTIPDYQPPQCAHLSSGLFQQASQQMVIAAKNSVSMNFYRRFRRYLKVRYKLDKVQAYNVLKSIQADTYDGDDWLVLNYRRLLPAKPKYGQREDYPELVMPMQYRFLKYFESMDEQHRLFTLLPMKQGFEISHVKICSNGLQGLLKRSDITCIEKDGDPMPIPKATTDFRSMADAVWRYLFNISHYETATRKFAGEVLTDGKAVSIVLRKPKSTGSKTCQLDLDTFDEVWGLDPGRRDTFVASNENRDVTRCSTRKYYEECGFKRCNKKIQVWYKDKKKKVAGRLVCDVMLDIPCKKTTDMDKLRNYISFVLQHLSPLLAFHMDKRFRDLKFRRYVLRQRTIRRMCQQFSDTKEKRVLVGFGDWSAKDSAGIIKRCPAGPVKRFEQQLKRYCTVVSVDEYLTSQTCERCQSRLHKTHMHKHWNKKSDKPTGDVKERDTKVYGILHCANSGCKMLVDRDVNASLNILACLKCQLAGQSRPEALCRTMSVLQRCSLGQAAVVAEQLQGGVESGDLMVDFRQLPPAAALLPHVA